MISFAQNFEDVILARVFKGRSRGSYVDVGAHFPIIDSITEYFYRLGWRGINVEPLDAAYAELSAARPEDTNMHCAIGAEDGTSRFFALDGFSTLEEGVAVAHRAEGRASQELTVETLTLATVLNRSGLNQIDFLKVDVEGAEGTVLRSNDWQRFRPSIVLIEAIHPVTHAPSHDVWEWILRDARYEFVHFDGVNRFYWNAELERPNSGCFLPPNALDNFTPYAQIVAEGRAAEASRVAQYDRGKLAEIKIMAAAQSQAQTLQLSRIDEALRQMAEGGDPPPPSDAVRGGWQALVSARCEAQEATEGTLKQINNALQMLAHGDGGLAPHPLLQCGWRTVSRNAAALVDLQAQLVASQLAGEELRALLEVSEQRRLALLESHGASTPRRN
jgi:FkbM family methyltransferase